MYLRLIDMAYMKEALGSSRPDDYRVIKVSDFGFSSIPCVKAGSNGRCTSYIGTVPGLFLALIYRDYGSRLLESNVRSFLSVKTKVNRGIRNTIREDPGMFFAYNNGVALTASHVDIDETGIKAFTNLQIVNGGQTTVSLFKELRTKYRDRLYEVYVPMKLTVVSDEDAVDIVRNISVFVNTQNAVRESDLTSSTEFQWPWRTPPAGARYPDPRRGGSTSAPEGSSSRTRPRGRSRSAPLSRGPTTRGAGWTR